MPQLELIPVPLYQPTDPYNHQVDNVPIKALIDRILLVNSQVDINATVLTGAIGTQGTLSNRLAQSINPDGTLKTSAIDAAQHNIAQHSDGSILVNNIPVSYVRMLLDERSKLTGIASGSNYLAVRVSLLQGVPSVSALTSQISVVNVSEVLFNTGEFRLKSSDSIFWTLDPSGAIAAQTTFPASVRHLHFYDQIPVPLNPLAPDYQNYVVTSLATPYRQGSLRVFINGVRLTATINVTPGKAPRAVLVPENVPTGTWLSYSYAEDVSVGGVVSSGKFSLSSPITASDIISVDFDVLYS